MQVDRNDDPNRGGQNSPNENRDTNGGNESQRASGSNLENENQNRNQSQRMDSQQDENRRDNTNSDPSRSRTFNEDEETWNEENRTSGSDRSGTNWNTPGQQAPESDFAPGSEEERRSQGRYQEEDLDNENKNRQQSE